MTQPIDARLDPRLSGQRLDSSLARLAAASAVKPLPVERASRPADLADVADPSAAARALRETGPIRVLAAQLADLRKAISLGQRDAAAALAEPVRSSIKPLLAASQPQGSPPTTRLLFDADFLDLSGDADDADARLTLELGGPGGVRTASFASGTSIADIAETLGLLGKEIGLTATLSGNAILLDSDSPLSANFVGVRVLDDAGGNLDGSPASGGALSRLFDALATIDGAGDTRLTSLLDDAIRELEQTERARLLSKGLPPGDAAFTRDDLDVIREAQLRLVEEARRIGLITSPDPASTLDALRG